MDEILPPGRMLVGCILAVSLNLLFNHLGKKASSATPPEPALPH
ncbi:hypothetical protein [Streptomyces sp. NPDC055140]